MNTLFNRDVFGTRFSIFPSLGSFSKVSPESRESLLYLRTTLILITIIINPEQACMQHFDAGQHWSKFEEYFPLRVFIGGSRNLFCIK